MYNYRRRWREFFNFLMVEISISWKRKKFLVYVVYRTLRINLNKMSSSSMHLDGTKPYSHNISSLVWKNLDCRTTWLRLHCHLSLSNIRGGGYFSIFKTDQIIAFFFPSNNKSQFSSAMGNIWRLPPLFFFFYHLHIVVRKTIKCILNSFSYLLPFLFLIHDLVLSLQNMEVFFVKKKSFYR